MHDLDEREQSLLNTRDRLARWADQLDEKERRVEERQAELEERELAYHKACAALKKRVAVLDAADRAQAEASKAALENSAATVLQRAFRRLLVARTARKVVVGFRVLRGLERVYEAAASEYEASGNQLLFQHEVTKILEAADCISTRDSKELRSQRKRFVRKVMAAAGDDDDSVGSDIGSDTSSGSSHRQSDSEEAEADAESWDRIDENDTAQ